MEKRLVDWIVARIQHVLLFSSSSSILLAIFPRGINWARAPCQALSVTSALNRWSRRAWIGKQLGNDQPSDLDRILYTMNKQQRDSIMLYNKVTYHEEGISLWLAQRRQREPIRTKKKTVVQRKRIPIFSLFPIGFLWTLWLLGYTLHQALAKNRLKNGRTFR